MLTLDFVRVNNGVPLLDGYDIPYVRGIMDFNSETDYWSDDKQVQLLPRDVLDLSARPSAAPTLSPEPTAAPTLSTIPTAAPISMPTTLPSLTPAHHVFPTGAPSPSSTVPGFGRAQVNFGIAAGLIIMVCTRDQGRTSHLSTKLLATF